MNDIAIKLENISVSFEKNGKNIEAVKNVSLEINQGDIYGIVGYSGAGKSTLVRTINLLQKPTAGKVVVNQKTIYSQTNGQPSIVLKSKELNAERRKIGMIFQHFNLLEEQTVINNVKFALVHSKLSESEKNTRAQELLDLVGLSDREKAYPIELSGGQKQRVAIARALANNPQILISDEATSALDPKNTLQILNLLNDLNKKLGLTIVLITHEMDAVKKIANKVAVMNNGEIIERGSLFDIFTNPESEFTKEIVGIKQAFDDAISIMKHSDFDIQKNVFLRLIYRGAPIEDPLITKLYVDFGVLININYGSVAILNDAPVGILFITLTGEIDQMNQAIEYLRKAKIYVDVIELERS